MKFYEINTITFKKTSLHNFVFNENICTLNLRIYNIQQRYFMLADSVMIDAVDSASRNVFKSHSL